MKKIEHIELYVANLPLALDFYKRTFQCIPLAYLNQNDRSSILIQNGLIRLILTSSSNPASHISQFIRLHGDGVKDIAFLTDSVLGQFELAISNKARPILKPAVYETKTGKILTAMVSAFGDITHTFIQRDTIDSIALPFFHLFTDVPDSNQSMMLGHIDHLAICVNQGDLAYWIEHYKIAYGFNLSHEEYVVTANSGMNSGVVQSPDGLIKLVFTEPVSGIKQSQIEEFLTCFRGEGVQHIAFSTQDILSTSRSLQNAGMHMLSIPDEYYAIQKNKFKQCHYDFNSLREHSILVDKNDTGFLYQAFSKPMSTRPTLFFEIIQRAGCDGFGSNNIKYLFQAMEQEQLKRESNQSG
ncbi:MAG: 4-hydroxyphenylpyruvate dioxygenase [Legionellaceae bacterium]|nr:4-hydroxyphenylpyruvate dioxygenase [Legionellaceae bacterium]